MQVLDSGLLQMVETVKTVLFGKLEQEMVIKQLTVSVTTTIETILHVFTMLSSNNC